MNYLFYSLTKELVIMEELMFGLAKPSENLVIWLWERQSFSVIILFYLKDHKQKKKLALPYRFTERKKLLYSRMMQRTVWKNMQHPDGQERGHHVLIQKSHECHLHR